LGWCNFCCWVYLSRMSTTKGEIYLCINESVDLAAAIGDNWSITALMSVSIKDISSTTLLTTSILVHSVHVSIWIWSTADSLLITLWSSQASKTFVSGVKTTIVSMMNFTPSIFWIICSSWKWLSKCFITFTNVSCTRSFFVTLNQNCKKLYFKQWDYLTYCIQHMGHQWQSQIELWIYI